MTPTTPTPPPGAPQLLSAERQSLAEQARAGLPAHTNSLAFFDGEHGYWVQAEAKFIPCSNPGTAISYYRQQLAKAAIAIDHNHGTAAVGRILLFAEHQAFRQQVAQELAGLHNMPWHPGDDEYADGFNAGKIHCRNMVECAASRLGLALPSAAPPEGGKP